MLQVYGEILFFPFAELIRYVAPSLPEFAVFYDLVCCCTKMKRTVSL